MRVDKNLAVIGRSQESSLRGAATVEKNRNRPHFFLCVVFYLLFFILPDVGADSTIYPAYNGDFFKFEWENGKLANLELMAKEDKTIKLKYNTHEVEVALSKGKKILILNNSL